MKINRLTLTSVLAAAAIALSTLESLVPIGAFIPIPGLKLGIANLAVMAALYFVGKGSGAAVGLIKVLAVFLTFGNVSSLIISACGTALAYISLLLTERAFGKYISFISVSAISAVCHATGQILAVCLLTGSDAAFSLLLPLGLCSVLTGALCGFLMNCVYRALFEKIKL